MGSPTQILLLLAVFNTITTAFVVIPYIQIDYAHLFRMAQCKSKCSEKYGTVANRQLLDGTVEQFFNTTSMDHEKCEAGCVQYRRSHKKGNLTGPTAQGHQFWLQSSAHSAKFGSSPISSVELLCQNPTSNDEYEDTNEGFIGLTRSRPAEPTHFVIQWKQRTYALGYYDETQWITASVESDTLIKVEGLIPGVQYKFMITAVGPNGKLGDTVTSEWAEIAAVPNTLKVPGGPLTIKNGYNSDHGVMAQLHFPRTAYDSCRFRLQMRNSTVNIQSVVSVDTSRSVILSHLEFDSTYVITLAALGADDTVSAPISTRFTSFQCKEVYGKGSLHCAPEPVERIRVSIRTNGTALVSWNPSAELDAILTYQVTHQAISGPCSKQPKTSYIAATSTSYELTLPRNVNCDFVLRITNYDAIGREAFAETRISIQETGSTKAQIPLVALLGISLCIFSFLVTMLMCCKCCCKCPARVSEDKPKLSDYA